MEDEFKFLQDRNIWKLVDLPKGQNPVRCRWVYDIKSDGCKKACLVAKGFSQWPGLDYDETFSPVARYETIRLLLATATLENWDIEG